MVVPTFETSALKLADYDSHPYKKGHQLLAEELIEQIMNHPVLVKAFTIVREG
ncbi:MAG: hypothetical protein KA479_06295 [Saprospiraceae bacterium]|nr:hypothetical protein [Saprospiraceae bacterium]